MGGAEEKSTVVWEVRLDSPQSKDLLCVNSSDERGD